MRTTTALRLLYSTALVAFAVYGVGCSEAAPDPADGGMDGSQLDGAPVETYSVGGTVSGLAGTGLVLQLNGANDLPIVVNGSFTFSTEIADGALYALRVRTQPSSPAQTCEINNGNGTISSAS